MADEQVRGKHAKLDGSDAQQTPMPDSEATELLSPVSADPASTEETAVIDETANVSQHADSPTVLISPVEGGTPTENRAQQAADAAGPASANAFYGVPAATAGASGDGSDGKKNGKRTALKVILLLVALVALAYVGISVYYQSHFLPRTTIGAYDVSDLSVEEASKKFEEIETSYELTVKGGGLDFTLTREETGLQVDSEKVARLAMNENPAWTWPYYFGATLSQDLSDAMQATYDKDAFDSLVKQKVDEVNKDATDPISASIAYDKDADGFQIVPEQLGTKLDADVVVAKAEEAAQRMSEDVEIGEDELLRPPLLADDERLAAAVTEADALLGAEIDVQMNGKSYDVVGNELIASWIVLGDDVKPSLSEDRLRDWTGEFSKKVNTVGAKREYTTPRGEAFTVEGGPYGWEVDYDAFVAQFIDAVKAREKTVLDVPCTSTAAELPNENKVDWGKRYVDVNLTSQHAVFYDGDEVIWESDIVSGSPDGKHATPYGVYCINVKESPSKLVGEMVQVTIEEEDEKGKKKKTTTMQPEYETVVQYWMAFVGNAIGFHDATWQPGFGDSLYMSGYGSHGCVNLPYDAAEQLYGIITEGTPVVVHG